VTRRDVGARLGQGIGQQGGTLIEVPVTRTEAAPVAKDVLEALRAGRYNWLLLASPKAVEYFSLALERAAMSWADLPGLRIAAVGAVTGDAIREAGAAVAVQTDAGARALAEAVLAQPGAEEVRALVPRASGGRDDAIDLLRSQGAFVEAVEHYATVPLDPEECELKGHLRDGVDALVCYAPSQVAAVFSLLGADATKTLEAIPVIGAIGATTEAAWIERGVAVRAVPDRPDAGAMVAALVAAFDED
jgi:uroporphyrinogen III methyltransferase/synthase